jgi:Chlorite dismutase
MSAPHDPEQPAIARVSFAAGPRGEWRVERMTAVRGAPLREAGYLDRIEGADFISPPGAAWILRGVRSNERYLERAEKERLAAVQQGLGRPASVLGALIPIRKSAAWWELPQDERRAVFEARSRHIAIGAGYLPAVARRLYHARDLGEPFDFLTWFEFAERDVSAFDELLSELRATEEWRHVTREVEIRVRRA